MNAERILRLRRRQIRCVAIGTLGALALLAGAVAGWKWLFIAGGVVFALALLAIFVFGVAAILLKR